MASLIDRIKQFIVGNRSNSFRRKHERIGFIKDNASAAELEKKLNRLSAENLALSEEIAKYRAENLVLREEIAQYKTENSFPVMQNGEIKEKQKTFEKPSHVNLAKGQQDILILLLKNSGMNEKEIIDGIDRNPENIHIDLKELKRAELIESQHLPDGLDFFILTHAGIKYVIENKFIWDPLLGITYCVYLLADKEFKEKRSILK